MGDPGLISRLGRLPGEGNGNLFQCSRLENPMDRGAWQATVHGVAKSRIPLSDFRFHFSTNKPRGIENHGLNSEKSVLEE